MELFLDIVPEPFRGCHLLIQNGRDMFLLGHFTYWDLEVLYMRPRYFFHRSTGSTSLRSPISAYE